MMNCVFVIEGISRWVINWLMNTNWLYDALISSDKPVLLLLCLISSREIKFIVPLMADEVKPSVCSTGLSLKWSSLRTSHSRGGRLRKDIAVTCFSNQVKKKAFVWILPLLICSAQLITFTYTFSGFWFTDFLPWVTQHPLASSLLLPGNCPGGARERTQSSWRTSWRSAKRISGELKRSKVYLWRRSTSLAVSVTST